MTNKLARHLRSNPTEAERILWQHLRKKQVGELRFRRQFPIGPHVVDFVCLNWRLIVELDGGQHDVQWHADAKRMAWLESQNFRVIRFWNNDVLANMEGVLASIVSHLESPPPRPSPVEGEGGSRSLR